MSDGPLFSFSHIRTRRLLVLLLSMYVALGLTYLVVVPPFERPDEWSHLSLVHYFARHRTMPPRVQPGHRTTEEDVIWFLEYHDPPLYYAPPLYYGISALVTSGLGVDMDDLPDLLVPSPSWEVGWVPEPGSDPRNKNIYVHQPAGSLKQSGTFWATVLLRLMSLGWGGVTVSCTYLLARFLWPQRRLLALGAAACVALNPKFISVSTTVTNDSLLCALAALFLVMVLRLMLVGAAWYQWALLGGLLGLGLLTKQSALLLLPMGLLAVIGQSRPADLHRAGRGGVWRKVLMDGGVFVAAALVVGGWWYARNAILYDDTLGLDTHLAAQTSLVEFSLSEVWKAARSYWAAFGWAPILVEPWMYIGAGLVILSALVGLVMSAYLGGSLWSAPPMTRRGLVLLVLTLILNVVTFVRWAVATGASTGRLLFPTLPVTGILIAWGLSWWGQWRVGRWGLGVIAGLALLLAAVVPWYYLHPAYASPYVDEMPATAQSMAVAFEGGVQLAGYEVAAEAMKPGEAFRLTLYWYTPVRLHQRYRVWVQLGPRDPTRRVAQDGSWLGGTLYPSDLWRAGDTVQQTYRLQIPDWAPAPSLYWVRLGLLGDTEERILLAGWSDDTVVLGPWRMRAGSSNATPAYLTDFRLGTAIRLLGYDLEKRGDNLEVTLHWRAEQACKADYTVYVHLVDEGGQLIGQHDGFPKKSAYPTSWWLPGDVVVDRHVIRLDEPYTSSVQLLVGMYNPTTMNRLPAYDGSGRRLPNNAIPLKLVVESE